MPSYTLHDNSGLPIYPDGWYASSDAEALFIASAAATAKHKTLLLVSSITNPLYPPTPPPGGGPPPPGSFTPTLQYVVSQGPIPVASWDATYDALADLVDDLDPGDLAEQEVLLTQLATAGGAYNIGAVAGVANIQLSALQYQWWAAQMQSAWLSFDKNIRSAMTQLGLPAPASVAFDPLLTGAPTLADNYAAALAAAALSPGITALLTTSYSIWIAQVNAQPPFGQGDLTLQQNLNSALAAASAFIAAAS